MANVCKWDPSLIKGIMIDAFAGAGTCNTFAADIMLQANKGFDIEKSDTSFIFLPYDSNHRRLMHFSCKYPPCMHRCTLAAARFS
jgi:hypothetical protein